MKFTLHIVGTQTKRTINALSVESAVAAFGKSIVLPQAGWVLIDGEDDTHKQYPIRNSAIHTEKEGYSPSAASSKTELVIEQGTGSILFLGLAVISMCGGIALAFLSENMTILIPSIILAIWCSIFSVIFAGLHENKQRLIDIQDQLNTLRGDQSE